MVVDHGVDPRVTAPVVELTVATAVLDEVYVTVPGELVVRV